MFECSKYFCHPDVSGLDLTRMILVWGVDMEIQSMHVYLDMCCFNRPFDAPSQLRIRLEAEAKLKIQEAIRARQYKLIWSYILDYENQKNPVQERKAQVSLWRTQAWLDVSTSQEILETGKSMQALGFKKLDALKLH
jgi:hypothetical protein